WIDGVIDRTDAHDPVPRLEMAPGIPGERRDPVAQFDAVAVEPLRDLQRARTDLGIGRGVERALYRARHYAPLAVVVRGMVDHAVAQQWPILHQPEHGGSPLVASSDTIALIGWTQVFCDFFRARCQF